MHAELKRRKLASLTPAQAAVAARGGFFNRAVLLDVREPEQFAAGHAAGAINVPLYTLLREPEDGFDRLRQFYFGLFGLSVPVRNLDFAKQVAAAAGSRSATVVLLCQNGGTLETKEERKARNPRLPKPIYGKWGAASRSLMGAAELYEAGFSQLRHVAGGYSQWCTDGEATE